MNDRNWGQPAYDHGVTTALDALALLLVAFAAGYAVSRWWGLAGAAGVAGLVIFGGARLAELLARRLP